MGINELKDYWRGFLDLLYPQGLKCVVCGNEGDLIVKLDICVGCYGKIQFIDGREKPEEGLNFEYIYPVAYYNDIVKKIVYDLKYHERLYLANAIAILMKKKLEDSRVDFDIIIPVPLYSSKEKQRGFNQTSLICKELSNIMGRDYSDGLIRIRNTEDMNKLSRNTRFKNVEGAFKVKDNCNITNKKVLLVDDVLTTGATVNDCTRVLINVGAKSVKVLTFARGTI